MFRAALLCNAARRVWLWSCYLRLRARARTVSSAAFCFAYSSAESAPEIFSLSNEKISSLSALSRALFFPAKQGAWAYAVAAAKWAEPIKKMVMHNLRTMTT